MNLAVQIALIAGVFIAAASVLGISLANAKNAQKGQVESLYEKENRALAQALQRQEQESLRLQQKVDALSQANSVLQQTVSGTMAVKELAKEIAREETARREEHATFLVLVKDLIAQVRQARGEIGR